MNMYPYNPLAAQQIVNPYVAQPVYNPTILPQQQIPQMVQPNGPHREIDVVNGKESAIAYSMGPNSSAILADAMNPKIWMVTTDASGFKAVKGFKIIPDEEEEAQSNAEKSEESDRIEKLVQQNEELEERLKKLEERMNSYGQSASKSSWQNKSGNANAQPNDRNGQSGKGSDGGYQPNG